MAAPEEASILFADIVGSTKLYAQMGNEKAEALVNASLQEAGRLTVADGGEVIKTIGDAIMSCFAKPDAAAAAAVALQRHFTPPSSVAWRIGFHHGEAVRRDGDVFGDAVNVASRICDLAKSRQILTTAPTVALLKATEGLYTRALEQVELKGRPGLIGLHELLQDTADLTALSADHEISATMGMRLSKDVLVLSLAGAVRVLTRKGGSMMVGRDPSCEFRVVSDKTSRTHVKIESRRNGFFAVDQSTNGTLIHLDGREIVVKRDAVPLLGTGWLSPGGRLPLPEPQRVMFRVGRDATEQLPLPATPRKHTGKRS